MISDPSSGEVQGAAASVRSRSVVSGGDIPIGTRISHYQILAKIGEGGMGAVYKALDSNLDRTVALKVISHEFITPEDKRRFAREAKSASALNHPNIVTIYEYNSDAALDFIAMELVDGVPLDRLLQRGEVPSSALLDYARQVASGLARAHAAGIVHRDLKPGNIMITSDGVAKVLDFGLARQEGAASPHDATTALTRLNVVMGTPAYMSPEQVIGETADYRSDIFSFGVILYEMFCGRRPFQGEDSPSTLRQILYKEPDPIRTEVPSATAELIAKCLQKKKEDRPSSMTEVVAALSTPAIETVSLSAVSAAASRPWKKFTTAGAATLLVLAAAATFLVSSVRQPLVAPHPVAQPAASPPATDSTDGTASEVTSHARALLGRYDKTGYLDRSIRLLESALEKDSKFAPAYAAIAEAYLRKGRSTTNSDDHWIKLARDAANQAVSINPDLAEAHASLGDVLVETGETAQAKTELDRALQLDPLSPAAYLALARLTAKSDPPSAEKLYQKASALAPGDWIPHSEYGRFLYRAAKYAQAAEQWDQASRIAPDNVSMLRNLGAAYHMMDQFDKSASALQKALEIEPTDAVWNNLGTARFFQGHYTESIEAFQKAVDLNPNNYLNWANLGDAYRWAPGQRNKATQPYAQAIALVRDLLMRDPRNTEYRGRLALYLAKSGNADAARSELADLTRAPKLAPADFFKMALAWEILGDRNQALESLGKAVRGGYSLREIRNEPELAALRADVRYHDLIPPPV